MKAMAKPFGLISCIPFMFNAVNYPFLSSQQCRTSASVSMVVTMELAVVAVVVVEVMVVVVVVVKTVVIVAVVVMTVMVAVAVAIVVVGAVVEALVTRLAATAMVMSIRKGAGCMLHWIHDDKCCAVVAVGATVAGLVTRVTAVVIRKGAGCEIDRPRTSSAALSVASQFSAAMNAQIANHLDEQQPSWSFRP